MFPEAPIWNDLAKWAVPQGRLPAVAAVMTEAFPPEDYDPDFHGQELTTYYFDTPNWDLRKARAAGKHYATVRLRCYPGSMYALSVKTEEGKVRWGMAAGPAEMLLSPGDRLPLILETVDPPFQAAILGLVGDARLGISACVEYTRYAVEGPADRLTLDTAVATGTGQRLPYAVLEYKGNGQEAMGLPSGVEYLDLPPLKMSKFLWATGG